MNPYEQQAEIGPSPYPKNSGVASMREEMEKSLLGFVEEIAPVLKELNIRPRKKGISGFVEEREKREVHQPKPVDIDNTEDVVS